MISPYSGDLTLIPMSRLANWLLALLPVHIRSRIGSPQSNHRREPMERFLPLRPLTLTRSGPARISGSLDVFLCQDAYSQPEVLTDQRRSMLPHLDWLMHRQGRSLGGQGQPCFWTRGRRGLADCRLTPDQQSFSLPGEFH